MCRWSHGTSAAAEGNVVGVEERDFRSTCQCGAGTARYLSANRSSVGSNSVGGVSDGFGSLGFGLEER